MNHDDFDRLVEQYQQREARRQKRVRLGELTFWLVTLGLVVASVTFRWKIMFWLLGG